MSKWLDQLADNIFLLLQKSPAFSWLAPMHVRRDIRFHGMEIRAYYVKKLALILKVGLCGMLLLALSGLKSFWQAEPLTALERPLAGEAAETRQVLVEPEAGELTLQIYPRELTWEEADGYFGPMLAFLEEYILGENESALEICSDLVLPEEVEGYPFTLSWKSGARDIISDTGAVDRAALTAETEVELTLEAGYGSWQWQYSFTVTVLPEALTESEQWVRDLEQLLKDSEENSRQETVWTLPEELAGRGIRIFAAKDSATFFYLLILFLILPPALWAGQDRELWNRRKKRRSRMRQEYPEFVSSLSLYIAAGLNLPRALAECEADYQRDGGEAPAGRQLSELMKRLRDGHSFYQALDIFAEDCDEEHYRRLAGILKRADKNSMRGLARQLETEAAAVQEEIKRHSRAQGEQISTKLLGPMMIQLAIVMGLIMIPAFASF